MALRPYQPGIRDTVNAMMARALADRPDDVFVDMGDHQLTFRQFDARADAYARGLRDAGIGKGETVCSLADSSIDMLVLWFSVNRLGAIWVPLNSALKGEFLRHQIEDSKARLMIVDPHYVARVAAVADRLDTLQSLRVRAEGPHQPVGSLVVGSLAELREGERSPLTPVEVDPTDPSLIIYTSGTTGVSKGCLCSHNYLCNYARAMSWAIGVRAGDRFWFALPLFHIGGLGGGVLGGLSSGARLVIASSFSVSDFWPHVERSGATVALGVGAMFAFVIDGPDSEAAKRCYGQIRAISAAPLSMTQIEKARLRFGVQHIGQPAYGTTEVSFPTLYPIAETSPPGTSGRRYEDFLVRITDENGEECAAGVPGRILVKPNFPQVMFDGYWHNPQATAAATAGDWFDTGDIGKFDEEGFFTFLDRAKDYLRRRGENISSFEVETALLQHGAIEEVAVHAVKAEVGEDELKATMVLKTDTQATEREICEWSIEVLPYFAVPRFIEFRRELPKNPTGRVLKYQLRDEGVTPDTWDRSTEPDLVVTKD